MSSTLLPSPSVSNTAGVPLHRHWTRASVCDYTELTSFRYSVCSDSATYVFYTRTRTRMKQKSQQIAIVSDRRRQSERSVTQSEKKKELTKNCWSVSLAKLMQNCSNELCSNDSKPNTSRMPIYTRAAAQQRRLASALLNGYETTYEWIFERLGAVKMFFVAAVFGLPQRQGDDRDVTRADPALCVALTRRATNER